MSAEYMAALHQLDRAELAAGDDDEPRGAHTDLSGGRSRRGVHQRANARRRREQARADARAAQIRRDARRRAAEPPPAPPPTVAGLEQQLTALAARLDETPPGPVRDALQIEYNALREALRAARRRW